MSAFIIHKLRFIGIGALGASLCIFSTQNAAYADLKVSFDSAATKDGTFSFNVRNADGSWIRVVKNIPKGTSAQAKRDLIFAAIPAGSNCSVSGIFEIVCGPPVIGFAIGDSTGQMYTVKDFRQQKAKKVGQDGSLISGASSLAGLDSDGNESIFATSIGFSTLSQTVSAMTQFPFSQIGGSSIDSWLSKVFVDLEAQLPLPYQSGLFLDLDNDVINYVFPEEALAGTSFASVQSTDVNAGTSLHIDVGVPGPTPVLGAAAAFGYTRRLKRRIKAANNNVTTAPFA
jgi:hypothetical protein